MGVSFVLYTLHIVHMSLYALCESVSTYTLCQCGIHLMPAVLVLREKLKNIWERGAVDELYMNVFRLMLVSEKLP